MLSPKIRQARRGKSNFLRRIRTQCACVCWSGRGYSAGCHAGVRWGRRSGGIWMTDSPL